MTWVSGTHDEIELMVPPMASGGGPAPPSRKNGKNSSVPSPCAARAVGTAMPSAMPMLMKARAPSSVPATTPAGSSGAGSP